MNSRRSMAFLPAVSSLSNSEPEFGLAICRANDQPTLKSKQQEGSSQLTQARRTSLMQPVMSKPSGWALATLLCWRSFGGRNWRRALFEQPIEQGAQIGFVLEVQVSPLAAGLGTDHAGTIDDDDLRNPQHLRLFPAQVLVDFSFIRIAGGIG